MKKLALLFVLCASVALAVSPSWWNESGTRILEEGGDAENYAPANLGQLKHVASSAKKYLDENLVGGAGGDITALVNAFEPRPGQSYTQAQIDEFIAANYGPINLGQLKAVAKPFYDRLLAAGYDTKANLIARGYPGTWNYNYPWNPSTPVAENYAPANLGQLKMVFSFDLGALDADGDGLTNQQEKTLSLNPLSADSDSDGMPDGWEVAHNLNPLVNDAAGNADGDKYDNLWEYLVGLDPAVADTWVQVAAGAGHTLLLKADGTVWAWGDNGNGQLGDNSTVSKNLPVQVKGVGGSGFLTGVVALAAGDSHSVAVKSDGTVWAWGANGSGQLGDDTTTQRLTPVQVKGPDSTAWLTGITSVSAGGSHTVAVTSGGNLYAWGFNSSGQLGDNTTGQKTRPVAVLDVSGLGVLSNVTQVSAGYAHTLAVKSDGSVYAWGLNTNGRLGDGTTVQKTRPVAVSVLTSGVSSVSAGYAHSLARKSDGTVYAWGYNLNGRLGDGTTSQRTAPVQVKGLNNVGFLTDVVAIEAGYAYSSAVKSDGTVWTWGLNTAGELGDGTTTQRTSPVAASGVSGAIGVAAGTTHTVAIKRTGAVVGWGSNASGQLANEITSPRTTPVEVSAAGASTRIAAGSYHNLAVRNNGTVQAWGWNDDGELGDDSQVERTLPVAVSSLTGVADVAAGDAHSLALKTDGSLWAWGSNANGRLGDGTTTTRLTPVQVLTGVAKIAAGDSHSLAIKTDGTLWAWGINTTGRLGDGTTTQRTTPTQVVGPGGTGHLTSVIAVSGGMAHTLAVKSDGTVWAWGNNANGRLGDDTTTSSSYPVQVKGPTGVDYLTGVVAVAAGNTHNLALKGDGTVWAWGANTNGRLGDGTTMQKTRPVQVSGLTGVIAIAAAYSHSIAVKSDGTVWAWGNNNNGQLGDGTTTQRTSPVQITTLASAVAVKAGYYHNIVLKSDGTIAIWGLNSDGELGIGYLSGALTEAPALKINAFHNVSEVALTGPTVPTQTTFGTTTNVTVTVTPGKAAVSRVEYYNEGAKIAEITQAPWSYPWQPVTWGAFHVSATVVDAEGNKSPSAGSVTLTVPFDSDNDSLPDWWEFSKFGTLTPNGSQDTDGDGLTNLQEYQQGSDPADYYSQGGTMIVPVITIQGGNNQAGAVGKYLPNPFTVEVRNSSGGALLNNAPVVFTVQSGGGGLAATSGSPSPASPLTVRTNASGLATASYKQGSVVGVFSAISAKAGASNVVEFTSEALETDDDNDGLPDSWELTYFEDILLQGAGDNPDGDPLTNAQEYAAGSDPTDYYSQGIPMNPIVTIVSGNNQSGLVNRYLSASFKVEVRNGSGGPLLVNAPVDYTVVSGGGGLAATSGATSPTTTVKVRTDASGQVEAYYKQGTTGGVTSQIAVKAGSSAPVTFQSYAEADSDNDEMADSWEQLHFNGLAALPSEDPDDDGLNNLQEYQLGSDPNNYYSQGGPLIVPTIAITGGNNQTGPINHFLQNPFKVEVRNSNGGALLVKAPVVFTVVDGGGGLAASGGSSSVSSSLTVKAATDGAAAAYYKQSSTAGVFSHITAKAGTGNTVEFSSEAVVGDSDSLPDSWELQYFGNLDATEDGDPDGDGLTNLQEYQQGSDPTNYYSQGPLVITPVLDIVSGDNQAGQPQDYLSRPFVVEVRNSSNGQILENAPVSFTVSTGGGLLYEALNSGDGAESISVRTIGGLAQARFKQGSGWNVINTVTVQAGGSSPVVFHSITGSLSTAVSLTGRWNLDETEGLVAQDSSGHAHDAVVVGNPVERYGLGVKGFALRLDGVDDGLQIDNAGHGLIPDESGAFSLAMWVKADSLEGNVSIALACNEAYQTDGFRFGIMPNTLNEWRFTFWSSESGGSFLVQAPQLVAPNRWYHVVITYDGSQAKIYLDGQLDPASAMGSLIANTRTLEIGRGIGGHAAFKGLIDNVVAAKGALGPAEVRQLFQQDAPVPILTSGVISTQVGGAINFPLTFSNVATSVAAYGLPSGLTLNPTTHAVEGAATAAGIYTATIEAANSYGTASSALTIVVSASAANAPIIDSPLTATATIGSNFAYRITAANEPSSYGATGLPAGLTVEASTGIISGVPLEAGNFTVTIQASNAGGSDSEQLVLTIGASAGAAPVINSPASVTASVGVPFTYAITASNSPVSFSAEGLPIGLSLDEETGVISGTPESSGVQAVLIRAANSYGSASQMVSIDVAEAPSAITSPLQAAAGIGELFLYQITASNHPTSFLVSGLPEWLSFDAATGVLSGVPSEPVAPVTVPYDVVVSLAAANAVNTSPTPVQLTITVGAARPVITSSLDVSALKGDPLSYQITASGNPGTFGAEGLPTGLTLNTQTGLITGTPTDTGNSVVRIWATNSTGEGESEFLHLKVSEPGLPEITSASKIYVVQNQPFSYEVSATPSPNAYQVTGLPAGVTFNPDSHVLSGTLSAVGTPEITLSVSNVTGTTSKKLMIVVLSASSTVQAVMEFRNGASPRADYLSLSAGISYDAADSSVATRTGLGGLVGSFTSGKADRTLLNFDLSDLPQDAIITSGELRVTGFATGVTPVELHDTVAFDPTLVTWNANSSYTTDLLASATASDGAMTEIVFLTSENFVEALEASFASQGESGLSLMLVSPVAEDAQVGLPKAVTLMSEYASLVAQRPLLKVGYTTAAPPEIGDLAGIVGIQGTAFSYKVLVQNAPASYAATGLPPGLSINSSTGVVSGTPTAAGDFPFVLSASNANGTGTRGGTFRIHPAAPPITSPLTATVPVRGSFSYTIGATGATSFDATGLPAGLTIDKITGIISGIPTAWGTLNIVIKATNAGGTTTSTLVLTVQQIAPVITSSLTANGNVGASFGYWSSADNGVSSYAATGLPGGLSINTASGYISGTPTLEGSYEVQLTATNPVGSDTKTLVITIGPKPVPVVAQVSWRGQLGQNFYQQIQASNSPSSYQASNLPPGLSVSSWGQISGMPTISGTFVVSITATNQYGVGTGEIEIEISAGPIVISPATAIGAERKSFAYYLQTQSYESATVTASGLPPGLSLQNSTISGIPVQPGTYPVSLAVTNSYGTTNFLLTIVIQPLPVLTNSAPIAGQVGVPFNFSLSADHSPTAWAITGLPMGLEVNTATGVITGTPTAAGQFLSEIKLTNEAGIYQGQLIFNISAASSDQKMTLQEAVSPMVGYRVSTASISQDSADSAVAQSGDSNSAKSPVGRISETASGRMLLAFDLSLLPEDATVTMGSLEVFIGSGDLNAQALEVRLFEAAVPFDQENPNWIDNAAVKPGELGRATLTADGTLVIPGSTALAQAIQTARNSETPILYLSLQAPLAETGTVAFASLTAHATSGALNPKLIVNYTAGLPTEAPKITSPLEFTVFAGNALDYGITASNSPTGFGASGLPSGYDVDTQTGRITGSSSLVGESEVDLTATNVVGTGEATLLLKVDSLVQADQLGIVSGDRQSAGTDEFLALPLVVEAKREGMPVQGTLVTFRVPEGDGFLALDNTGAAQRTRLSVVTDTNGRAQIYFRTPSIAKTVEILAESGNAAPVKFLASSVLNPDDDQVVVRVVSGNAQVAASGSPLADPVWIEVVDGNGLPIMGAPLSYTVLEGGATVAGDSATGSDGRASLSMTLAGTPGTLHRVQVASGGSVALVIATTASSTNSGDIPGGNPNGNPVGGDPTGDVPSPGGSGTKVVDGSVRLAVSSLNVSPQYVNDEYDPTTVKLSWSDDSEGEQGFRIERKISDSSWVTIAVVGSNVEGYVNSGLKANRRYFYRVTAFRDNEISAPSQVVYRVPLIKNLERRRSVASAQKMFLKEFIPSGGTPKYYKVRSVSFWGSDSSPEFSWNGESNYSDKIIYIPDPAAGYVRSEMLSSGSSSYNSYTSISGLIDSYTSSSTVSLNGHWSGTYEYRYHDGRVSSGVLDNQAFGGTGGLLSTTPTREDYGYGSVVLSGEYSTSSLIADGNAALPVWGAWFDTDEGVGDYVGHWNESYGYGYSDDQIDFYPYWYEWGGYRDLSSDEASYAVSKTQYRFKFYPAFSGLMSWYEVFCPENDLQNYLIHKSRSVDTGSANSGEYIIDPRERGEDGSYLIVPGGAVGVSDGNDYKVDEKEKYRGVQTTKDRYATASFSFSPTRLSSSTYTVSWTNSVRFRVYAYNYRTSTWDEIQSGQQWTGNELADLGYREFKVVAADSLDVNASTTVTVKTTANGRQLDTFTANFVYKVPSGSLSMPLDEASGARYRKIGLNGIPLPDGKPQQTEESGQEPEETFVDALTLGLRHSTTDIYIPVPGSDFSLSARRDYQSEVWNLRSGVRPQEDPTKPFGACWSSNLVPHVKIITGQNEPTKAYVTDESGATHAFVIWYEAVKKGDQVIYNTKYFPMPTAKHQQTPNLDSLEEISNGTSKTYVFKRKFGSTLTFQSAMAQSFLSNRFNTVGSQSTVYTYARLVQAVDRLGYTLNYSYQNDTNLIPKTITVKDHPDLKISIQQDAGLITKIWDAKGYATTFEYESDTYTDLLNVHPIKTLTRVVHPDGSVTKYSYVLAEELDKEPNPPQVARTKYWHCDLASITDPLNRTYTIDYNGGSSANVFDHSKRDYKSDDFYTGYFAQSGLPRNVRRVSLPNGAESSFFNDSDVWISRMDSGLFRANGQRRTEVTDVQGLTRTYSFVDPVVIPLPEITKTNYTVTDNFRLPKIVVYQTMLLNHGGQGTETFEFNLDAAMALKRVTDLSGNTTTYTYGDGWNAPSTFTKILDTGAYLVHSDPTAQKNALGGTKHFSYTADSRLMKSITDEEGRTTSYEMDSRGRRTKETITGDGTTQVTKFVYGNSKYPGFVTRKEVQKQAGDSSPTSSLVTESTPDANGRLAKEVVAPGSLNLTTTYTYDANGNRKSMTDPRGNVTTFSYDKCNRLVAVSYPDGGTKYLIYDARGNKTKELDENGRATLYAYDSLNRVITQARDMNGNGQIDGRSTDLVTSFTYNNAGAKLSETDPRGNTTSNEYDSLQRVTKTRDREGNSTTFDYGVNSGGSVFESSGFKPTRTVAPRGVVTSITYDKLYRPTLTSVTAPGTPTLTTSTQYDAVGNPLVTTDGLNRQTRTTYDGLNRPTVIRFPDGTTVENSYSSTGLKWKVKDELGRESVTEYDAAGRSVLVRQPSVDRGDGVAATPETHTIYDTAGNVLATINPLGRQWDFTYDARNRKVREMQPAVFDANSGQNLRPTTTTRYDAVGNVVSVTDALGNTSDTQYDSANRVTDVWAPTVPVAEGAPARPHTHTTYDANGNALTVTDPNGHTTTNTYDKLNRLLTTTDAAGITVSNQYDAAGNRLLVIDGRGQQTRFEYDGHNRNTKVIDALGRATSLQYDALNKTQRTDALGQVTSYTYDVRNRLKTVVYAGGGDSTPPRTHSYDAAGNLLAVTEAGKDGKADVAYTYDALNRVTSETSGGVTHQYRYDLAGNRLKVTYGGSGRELVSTYDTVNRLNTMTEGGRTTTYRYDLNGKVRKKELPGSTASEMTYDAAGRMQTMLARAGGSDLSLTINQYDLGGNVRIVEEQYSQGTLSPRTVHNTYDAINRLVTEAVDLGANQSIDTTTTYEYDSGNNRTKKTVVGGSGAGETTYTVNGLNQIVAADGPGGSVSYTYDANGNRRTRVKGAQSDTYAYDAENRLVQLGKNVVDAGTTPGAYRYTYDYRTRRVERDESGAGGQVTRMIFSGGLSCYELEGTTRTVEYIRGSDWGGGVGGILYTLRSNAPSFDHYNNRGDVVAKTDGSGAVTYQAQYEAFGSRTQEQGSTPDRQRMNTKEEDPTGLVNHGFRYFDLETDTWLTPDPAGFVDGPNLYAYVQQNPWTKFDPEGLQEADPNSYMSLRTQMLSDGDPEAAAQIQRGQQTAKSLTGALQTGVDVAGEVTGAGTFSRVGLGEDLNGQKVSGGGRVTEAGIVLVGGKVFKKVGEKLVELSKGAAKKIFEMTGGKITKSSTSKTAREITEETTEMVSVYHKGNLDASGKTRLSTTSTREEAEALQREGQVYEAQIPKSEYQKMQDANQVRETTTLDKGVKVQEKEFSGEAAKNVRSQMIKNAEEKK